MTWGPYENADSIWIICPEKIEFSITTIGDANDDFFFCKSALMSHYVNDKLLPLVHTLLYNLIFLPFSSSLRLHNNLLIHQKEFAPRHFFELPNSHYQK